MRVTHRKLRLRSCALAVAITMAGPGPSPTPAIPSDGFGWVNCDHASAACDVGADKGGSPAYPAAPTANRSSGSSTDQQCKDAQDRPTPCFDPQLGWLGSDGCYYKSVPPPSPAAQEAFGGARQGEGGWYAFVCPGLSGTGGGTRWIAGWTELVHAAPPGWVAPVSSVIAVTAYQRGDGVIAAIAAEHALLDRPGYNLARLVLELLQTATTPTQIRRLITDAMTELPAFLRPTT